MVKRLELLAAFAESEANGKLAEEVYRRILQLDPDAHVASNNLAMILSTKESSLEEAISLATRAVDLMPHSTEYRDTLYVLERAVGSQRADTTRIGGR